jgi:hypothetical protein
MPSEINWFTANFTLYTPIDSIDKQLFNYPIYLPYPKYLHDLIAKVVDYLDSDST